MTAVTHCFRGGEHVTTLFEKFREATLDGRPVANFPLCDKMSYILIMSIAISVRLDDEAERALALLESRGLSRSEAIRHALVQSARHARRREELRQEMAELEFDQEDRFEMRQVTALMGALHAEG